MRWGWRERLAAAIGGIRLALSARQEVRRAMLDR